MNEDAPVQPASLTTLAAGTRLQEFQVTGVVGEGGFGIVYAATDTQLDRRVAIKEYMPSQLAARIGQRTVRVRSAEFADTFANGLKSFINEARMLAQFKHPALVEVFRFWEENGTAYMAMPLYDGSTFKDQLTRQPELASERWLRATLAPVMDALEQMHDRQVYHRDIAPDNLLILKNGAPLLLDLGAARRAIGDMTQAMTVILKPGYAPIEQYAEDPGMRQGPWTDIYALAALIYFAIMRRPPPAAVSRLIKDPFTPLSTVAPAGFSPSFLAAVDRALAVRPEDRPQRIDVFRQQLGIRSVTLAPAPDTRTLLGAIPHQAHTAAQPASTPVPPSKSGADPLGLDFDDLDKTLPPQAVSTVPAPGKTAAVGTPVPPLPAAPPARVPDKPASSPDARKNHLWAALVVGALILVLGGGAAFWWLGSETPPPTLAKVDKTSAPGSPEPQRVTAPSQPPSADLPTTQAQSAAATSAPATGPISLAPAPPPAPPPPPPLAAAPAAAMSTLPPTLPPTLPSAAPAGAPVAAAPQSGTGATAPEEKRGTMRISVRPWAEVFVNGASRGISPPLKRLTLPPGSYLIELRNPAGPALSRQIEIRHNQSIDIDHQFQ